MGSGREGGAREPWHSVPLPRSALGPRWRSPRPAESPCSGRSPALPLPAGQHRGPCPSRVNPALLASFASFTSRSGLLSACLSVAQSSAQMSRCGASVDAAEAPRWPRPCPWFCSHRISSHGTDMTPAVKVTAVLVFPNRRVPGVPDVQC